MKLFSLFKKKNRINKLILPKRGINPLLDKYYKSLEGKDILPYRIGWNLVREDVDKFYIDALYPKDERVFLFPKDWSWEHIGVALGLYGSMTEAKKTGFQGPLPMGYNERTIKSLHRKIYLYVPIITDE